MALLIGGGAYGVKTLETTNPNERSCLVSIADALQLMLGFGTFTVTLIALVVELIKNQRKK
ncbi:putative holin-like toxin [Ligilactobacillus sp. WILCCON 0076]|uniref:Holin-like toxin n=1 Tax=Ligilactobacillus ubinensis TaxID=2876789 RepID=A0A9X2JM63_9LACO|nr:putative holin-like toxin [Ligilactobacillus ubinensis]MCP0887355.1 putative holin-like toxin [Ligilactobacillus ubinensis]